MRCGALDVLAVVKMLVRMSVHSRRIVVREREVLEESVSHPDRIGLFCMS